MTSKKTGITIKDDNKFITKAKVEIKIFRKNLNLNSNGNKLNIFFHKFLSYLVLT